MRSRRDLAIWRYDHRDWDAQHKPRPLNGNTQLRATVALSVCMETKHTVKTELRQMFVRDPTVGVEAPQRRLIVMLRTVDWEVNIASTGRMELEGVFKQIFEILCTYQVSV